MARTSEQLSQVEVDAFNRFCNEHRIVCDDSNAGHANGNLMGDYIVFSWKENITQETLAVALSKLRDRLVFYSDSEWQYKKIADEDPARANTLNQWFHSSANSSLVKDGEQAFQNQSALLAELRAREITPQTIQDAIGRAGYKKGLHYVTTDRIPRPVDPRQHTDDGSGFMKKSETNLSARDHAKLAADAAAAGRPASTTGTDYRALAEAVTKGRTHSESARIQRLYVTKPGTSEILWPETYEARRRMAGLS